MRLEMLAGFNETTVKIGENSHHKDTGNQGSV